MDALRGWKSGVLSAEVRARERARERERSGEVDRKVKGT